MPDWIIIDGYNLLHRQGGGKDIAALRSALLRLLEQSAGAMAPRITLVFDGTMRSAMPETGKTFVETAFSPAGMSADALIEAMVTAAPRTAGIMVVTSDRLIMDAVTAAGAEAMSCSIFMNTLQDARKNTAGHIQRLAARSRGPTLGEFFP